MLKYVKIFSTSPKTHTRYLETHSLPFSSRRRCPVMTLGSFFSPIHSSSSESLSTTYHFPLVVFYETLHDVPLKTTSTTTLRHATTSTTSNVLQDDVPLKQKKPPHLIDAEGSANLLHRLGMVRRPVKFFGSGLNCLVHVF
jgi:hypothetical protein